MWFKKKQEKEAVWPEPNKYEPAPYKVNLIDREITLYMKNGDAQKFIVNEFLVSENKYLNLFPFQTGNEGFLQHFDYSKFNKLYIFLYNSKEVSLNGPSMYQLDAMKSNSQWSSSFVFGDADGKFVVPISEISYLKYKTINTRESEEIEYYRTII